MNYKNFNTQFTFYVGISYVLRFYTLSCLLNIHVYVYMYMVIGVKDFLKNITVRKLVMKTGPFYTDTHTQPRTTEQRYILSFNNGDTAQ